MIPDYTPILNKTVNELSDPASYEGLFHQYKDGELLPSAKSLRRIVELSREILFPGYFGNSTIHRRTLNYHIGVDVEELFPPAYRTGGGRILFRHRECTFRRISGRMPVPYYGPQTLLPSSSVACR